MIFTLLRNTHTYWAMLAAALVLTNCATATQRDSARRDLAELRTATAQAEALRSETARIAEASHRASERANTEALQAVTMKATHEKNRIAADLRVALDGLRNRPERPASSGGAVPEGASDGVGCTGAGLARPDAEFLVGYAADAAGLQSALAACQSAYSAAAALTGD